MEKKKVKKFRPSKNYRYLVGDVGEAKCKADLKEYNYHRYKIFTATSNLDHHPLKMNPYHYYQKEKLIEDIIRLRQIDRENKDLLKKINFINRNGGRIDSFNPLAYSRNKNWMSYQNNLKVINLENQILYKLISSATSRYRREDMEKDWQRTLEVVKHTCRSPYTILRKTNIDDTLKACLSISDGLEKADVDRPLCFLEFQEKSGRPVGQIVIELYYDHVPVTVQNFLEICNGKDLTYKNCLVHRIVKGQFLETGDITKSNGRGGFSIYGEKFHEENHMLKHTRAGIISMKRIGTSDNNSQFCITFKKMEQLDHKNVVFGKVIKGNEVLFRIEAYGRRIGKPYADIIISKCGQLPVPET